MVVEAFNAASYLSSILLSYIQAIGMSCASSHRRLCPRITQVVSRRSRRPGVNNFSGNFEITSQVMGKGAIFIVRLVHVGPWVELLGSQKDSTILGSTILEREFLKESYIVIPST